MENNERNNLNAMTDLNTTEHKRQHPLIAESQETIKRKGTAKIKASHSVQKSA